MFSCLVFVWSLVGFWCCLSLFFDMVSCGFVVWLLVGFLVLSNNSHRVPILFLVVLV